MKGTALFALFLLCAFTSYLPSSIADSIIDIDGETLLNGGQYYVLPVIRGKGGGITLAATGNETCPLTVVQSPREVIKGQPVRFASTSRIGFVHENLPLSFFFPSVPLCAPTPSEWTIIEGLPEGSAVKLNAYNNVVKGFFFIKKASPDFNDYKLEFCANTCRNIGIHIDSDKNRRLVLTDNKPLLVQFKRARKSLSTA